MNKRSFQFKKITARTLRAMASPQPARDWFIILAVSFATLILFFLAGAYLYVGARAGFLYAPKAPDSEAPTYISRDTITRLVSTFETRATNHEAGNVRRPNVSDPRE